MRILITCIIISIVLLFTGCTNQKVVMMGQKVVMMGSATIVTTTDTLNFESVAIRLINYQNDSEFDIIEISGQLFSGTRVMYTIHRSDIGNIKLILTEKD